VAHPQRTTLSTEKIGDIAKAVLLLMQLKSKLSAEDDRRCRSIENQRLGGPAVGACCWRPRPLGPATLQELLAAGANADHETANGVSPRSQAQRIANYDVARHRHAIASAASS
jgi:hypothetical protein